MAVRGTFLLAVIDLRPSQMDGGRERHGEAAHLELEIEVARETSAASKAVLAEEQVR